MMYYRVVYLKAIYLTNITPNKFNFKKLKKFMPWLVWLSGLSANLWTKGSPVQFPVRAHGPQWGARQRQPHIDVSLPLFLLPFTSLKINK